MLTSRLILKHIRVTDAHVSSPARIAPQTIPSVVLELSNGADGEAAVPVVGISELQRASSKAFGAQEECLHSLLDLRGTCGRAIVAWRTGRHHTKARVHSRRKIYLKERDDTVAVC